MKTQDLMAGWLHLANLARWRGDDALADACMDKLRALAQRGR